MTLIHPRVPPAHAPPGPRRRISIVERSVAEGPTNVLPASAEKSFPDLTISSGSTTAFSEVEEPVVLALGSEPINVSEDAPEMTSGEPAAEPSNPVESDQVAGDENLPSEDLPSRFRPDDASPADRPPDLLLRFPPRVKVVKKFTLMDPNQQWVMIVAIALLGSVIVACLAASFTSVYATAGSIGLPKSVQWLPVVILDVAIVAYAWALMVFSSRLADVDDSPARSTVVREKITRTRIYLCYVTGFSVVANFLHTFTYWGGHVSSPQAITGLVFSASIPLLGLAATEEMIRMVFVRRRKVQTAAE